MSPTIPPAAGVPKLTNPREFLEVLNELKSLSRDVPRMYDLVTAIVAYSEDRIRADIADDIHQAELPTFAATENPELVAKVVRAVDVRIASDGPTAPYGVAQGGAR